jgi:hypothetical protein
VDVVVIFLLLATGIIAAYIYYVGTVPESSTTTSSNYCGFYPIPGPCLTHENFQVWVNHTGSWRVTYQGYDCMNCNVTTVSGIYGGTRFDNRTAAGAGAGPDWMLCAQAEKSDAYNATLALRVEGAENSTALPFGSTSICIESSLV